MPEGAAFDTTHDDYIALATAAGADDRQRERLCAVGRELCRRQGPRPSAFEGRECGFPTIDSARVHIDALARASMGEA